jgi:class 3 adenylate cyclase
MHRHMHDRREGAMNYERPAIHRTIFAVDVEGYGDQRRTTPHRLALREGLYRALFRAFDDAGVPWRHCRREDCGDGVFVLAPAEIPKGPFVEFLPNALAVALHRHNLTHHAEARIRLRMALHAGEVAYDDFGVTAPAINQTFRLLEAAPLKEALKGSRGVLALITSAWFFDEVVRHSDGLDPTTFRPVPVAVKETRTTGWISLPDRPYPADARLLGRERVPVTAIDDYRTWRRFRRHAQVLADRDDPA